MTKRIALLTMMTAGGMLAQGSPATDVFQLPCSKVFPTVVQMMSAAQFEVKASDAAGGVLTLQYSGAPMAVPLRQIKQAFLKYVANATEIIRHGPFLRLSYSRAGFIFADAEPGCRVTADVKLAALSLSPNTHWELMPSNGTAERAFLEQITAAVNGTKLADDEK